MLPLHPQCTLLKRDPSGLVAVDKACGILSHPNSPREKGPALLDWPYDFEAEAYRGPEITWYLLNRLDAPTSGVILLADDPDLARAVKAAFAAHAVEKSYLSLIRGTLSRKEEAWRDCLEVTRRGSTLRTRVIRGRPNAVCTVELLRRGSRPPLLSLIAMRPETGRTHQLRVQCASRRLPIVGDGTYGDFAFNREFRRRTGEGRLFLHSWQTRLQVEWKGQVIAFVAESPWPAAFTVALGESPSV